MKGGSEMCEWLCFLMLFFGCETCDVNHDHCIANLTLSSNGQDLELSNDCPVRGIQFTITPSDTLSFRTTSRTEGFIVHLNETNGVVVLVSIWGEMIAPGDGPILEMIPNMKGGSVRISNIKIWM